jgi:glutamyl-tRNA synthetase
MPTPVRVRFAPSPTGALHVGGARTAIYNWAFARRTGGVFVLRIDDTDPTRSTAANTAQILRSLEWLGIDWDEGPEVGGQFGPYFQTLRTENYKAALDRMRASGSAYPCFCSAEELEAKREAARAAEGALGYDRTCRGLDPATVAARIAAGEPHVWRLAVPANRGDIVVDDPVRGATVFPATAMDDFVLARTDGTPTYNFVTPVDDAAMQITHVIRGDDHLTNTPLQILVYEALGHPAPVFAHLSMIWGADGRKLSKRHGATSVEAFHDDGFVPEALLNYLALLGWSLDGETTVLSAETLKANFTLERISKSPAVFDFEKLEWMNGVYIREMAPEAFVERMVPWLDEAGLVSADELPGRQDWLLALAPLVSARIKRMTEIVPAVRFLFGADIAIDPAAVESTLAKEGAGAALAAVADVLGSLADWTPEAVEAALRSVPEALGAKPKVVFAVARVAIAGSTVSLPLFESIALLGRETAVARLKAALAIATA